MRVSSSIKVLGLAVGGTLALGAVLSACYNPDPKPGSFSCDNDAGGICPAGFTCNPSGFCVRPGTAGDMLISEFDLSTNDDLQAGPRSCDQIVQAGALSNLVELKTINSAGDESHLAFDGKTQRLLFQRGSSLFSASLTGGLTSPAAPVAVSISSGPTTLNGGSFTSDGHYWFSGTSGGTTSLYEGTPSGGNFTAAAFAPTASCAFSDPVFVAQASPTATGSMTNDLFLSYPVNGCSGASYIARGTEGLNIGAFYSALGSPGYQSPTMTASGLTLMVSSTGTGARVFTAARSDTTYQFGSPIPLDMTGVGGAGTEDRQMVVSDDCSVAYFVSVRTGGTGGADIWAANISAK